VVPELLPLPHHRRLLNMFLLSIPCRGMLFVSIKKTDGDTLSARSQALTGVLRLRVEKRAMPLP
jgi:hypothetical protein